ncbi:hepatitis A virus cellular receptor 1 [Rhinolophus ferrumequinum]|uniref:Hepatitis A virus cellular receptor 1 n=1 Tax=Rhinolophus ferrumequinum TaxID=59479 RepID=A0A7J7RX95_RHIFE|nr:hepatitis A virus cellular receptor 1 [Rhinolophus ferrumequinum]
MRPWEAITGLILLWTDAVVSQVRVSGVVGQSVTLPCTYSTAGGVTAMCWGRGPCPWYLCSNQLIKTDGHRVIFQRNKRYELNGPISKGNVSLTIKNATQADSGIYCCRVELSGWFNDLKVNILLEMKPDTTSSSPMQTAETQLITPQETNTSSLPVNPCLTDGNGTVAEPSDGVWEYNETHMCLEEKERMTTNEALYIGISIPIVLLLAILTAIITKKYLCTRRKVLQIRKVLFNDPKNGTLENPAAVRYQADENIYIENNLYNVHSDSVAH